jgi:uncharacterized repeat protein (TIGR02543 family)
MKRTTRKLLSLLLALSMLFSLLPTGALAGEVMPTASIETEVPPASETPSKEGAIDPAEPADDSVLTQNETPDDPPLEQQGIMVPGSWDLALDANGKLTGSVEVTGFNGEMRFVLAVISNFDFEKSGIPGNEGGAINGTSIKNFHPNTAASYMTGFKLPKMYLPFTITSTGTSNVYTIDETTVPAIASLAPITASFIESEMTRLGYTWPGGKSPDKYSYKIILGSEVDIFEQGVTEVSPNSVISANDIGEAGIDGPTGPIGAMKVGEDDFETDVICDLDNTTPAIIGEITLSQNLIDRGIKLDATGIKKGDPLDIGESKKLILDTSGVIRTAQDQAFMGKITINYNGITPKIVNVYITIPGAAVLEIGPAFYSGQGANGDSSATPFTITNKGASPATIGTMSVDAPGVIVNPLVNENTDPGGSTLAPGQSATFTISWTGITGIVNGTVTVPYTGGLSGDENVTADFSIRVAANGLIPDPVPIACTSAVKSKELTLTHAVTNAVAPAAGNRVIIDSIVGSAGFTVSGGTGEIYPVSNTSGSDSYKTAVVTADGSKDTGILDVTYSQGPATGTKLHLYVPVKYSIADAPNLIATPSTLSWVGTTDEGFTPIVDATDITNSGTATADIASLNGITFMDDFVGSTFSGISDGDTIAVSDFKTVTVTPPASIYATAGTKSGKMIITYDGGTCEVSLTATITAPAPTTGSVEVELKQNTAAWAGRTVSLSTSDMTNDNAYTAPTYAGGIYTFENVTPGNYYIWVDANGSTAELASREITVSVDNVTEETVNYYGLAVTAETGGSVTGGSETLHYYLPGSLNLTATPDAGYVYKQWTSSFAGVTAPTEMSPTITVGGLSWTDDVTLTAEFELAPIALPVPANQGLTYGQTEYSYQLPAVTDPTEGVTYTYSLTGTLPKGLTWDSATRTISGRPAEVTSSAVTLTYTATSSVDTNNTASQTFTLEVGKATANVTAAAKAGAHYVGDTSSDAIDAGVEGATSGSTVPYYNANISQTYNADNWSDLSAVDATSYTYSPTALPVGGVVSVDIDGAKTNGSGSQSLGDVWNITPKSVTVPITASYTVTVNVTKNGSPYIYYNGETVTMTSGGVSKMGTISGNTATILNVPTGTYSVSINGGHTMGNIEVSGPTNVDFAYYEVAAATGTGAASATISGQTGGHEAETGIYLAGSVLTLTATAKLGYTGNAIWDNADVSSDQYTVAGPGAVTLTASFAAIPVELTNMTGKGQVGQSAFTEVAGGTASTPGDTDTHTYEIETSTTGTYSDSPRTIDGVTLTVKSDGGGFTVSGTPSLAGSVVFGIRATSGHNGTSATATATFTIAKGDQTAPTLTATDSTGYGTNDGTLTIGSYDASKTYEWSTDGTSGWTTTVPGTLNSTTGKVTGVHPGDYYVRVKGDINYNDSPASDKAMVQDGKVYTGSVTVKVDGNATSIGITKVEFVGQNSAVVQAIGTSGTYTANLNLDNDVYAVRVTTADGTYTYNNKTVNKDSKNTEVDLYTVKFTDATVAANAYATLGSATITAKVSTSPAGVTGLAADADVTSDTLIPAGTGVTFTIDETLDAKYDYSVSWTNAAPSGSQANARGAQATVNYTDEIANVTAVLTLNTYSVSGMVTPFEAFETVTIKGTTAEDKQFEQTVNVTNGTPGFTGVPNGTYTISYELKDSYSSADGFVTGHQVTGTESAAFAFAATITYTVSGTVTLDGVGWDGAMVSWGGKMAAVEANGSYSFSVTAAEGSTSNPLNITKDSNSYTTAAFQINDNMLNNDYTLYHVKVEAGANGSLSGQSPERIYKAGDSITLGIPDPSAGYRFKEWTLSGPGTVPGSGFTVPSSGIGSITLTANFEQIPIVWSGVTDQTTTYGADFSYAIPAVDSGYNVTFSVSGAPAWLDFDGTNTLSGKPPVIGTTTAITVTATSENGLTDSKTFTITVGQAAPTLNLAANGTTHYQGDISSEHITPTLTGGVYYNGDPDSAYNVSNWVTLTAAAIAAADALIFTPGTLPATGEVTVSVDGSKKYDTGTQDLSTVWAAVTENITLTMATTQSVTVNVTKDGSAYNYYDGQGVTITNGTVTRTGTLSDDTVTIPGVPTGTYTVSIDTSDPDPSLSATVSNADLTVSFDYYAVSVDATDASVASASISSLDSGHMAETGVYLNGSVLSLTATANTGYQQNALTWEGGTVTADKHTVAGTAILKPVFAPNEITFEDGDLSGKVGDVWNSASSGGLASAAGNTFTYAVKDSDTMPEGLTLNTDGTVTGTPTKAYTGGKAVVIVATASPTGATKEATWTFTIDKAEINAAAVTVAQPAANGTNTLADGVIVTGTPNFGQVTTWGSSNKGDIVDFGTVYTATVTLTPTDEDNYKFVAGTYTINGVGSGANVTVNVTDDSVTLTYTFPPTAPGLSVALEATSFDTATATPTVAGGGTQTVEYILKPSVGEPSETDWNTPTNVTGSFNTLTSYTTYHVYARAKVTIGGVDSTWSTVATASDTTFHKVTVDAGAGALVQPVSSPVGVDDGATLDIQVTPPANHKFTNWTTSGNAADITSNANPGQYEANSSSAAEVTLTANYEAGYGVNYNANGGSGTVEDATVYYESETVTTQTNAFTRQGYTFTGWNTKADGNGTDVVAGNAIPVSTLKDEQSGINPGEAFILYAQWEMNVPIIAAPTDGATTYGEVDYTHDGLSVSNGSELVNNNYTWAITDSDPHGMSIGSDGKITGRATIVGDIELNVTVTIKDSETNEEKTSDPVTVKIVADTADITGTPSYAEGNYYAGDAVDQNNLSGAVTAPYWNGTTWDENHAVTGGWSFDTPSAVYTAGTNQYAVTYTVSGADTALYNNLFAQVPITADAKTYGLELVDATDTGTAASGTFAGGVYLGADPKEVSLKVKNTGNQSFELTAGSYILSGMNGGEFEVSTKATGTVKGIKDDAAEQISSEVVIRVKNPGTLDAGTYTATLTVSNGHGENATLDLSYTVARKEIPSTTITGLVAPAKGGTPTAANDLSTLAVPDGNGKTPFTATITWDHADTTFKPGTEYTATVVLTADSNYYFANDTGSNHTIADTGTKSHTVNVATDASSSTVTFTEVFNTIPMAAPTPVPAVTAYNAGTVTITGQDDGAIVKFLVDTNGTATAADVWSGGTNYTGAGQPLSALLPNTTYYLHAVAGNDASGTVKSTVTSVSFKTPYEVVVETDGNGTVDVTPGGGGALSSTQTFSVYANTTDAGSTGIPASLNLTVAGNANHAFKGWTDAAAVISGTVSPYTLTPGGPGGTITVTANFTALYTIAFDENGGIGGTLPANLTDVKVGDEVTLPAPSPAFTRDGYDSGNGWASNTDGTGTKAAFGGTVTITDAMLSGIPAGGTLTFYHVWKSLALNIEPETLNAVYNMAQSDWTAAPSGPITINNGSGSYSNYALGEVAGEPSPLAFLEITNGGVIRLTPGARMGDAGTYKFTVSVRDVGKAEDAPPVVFTLTIAKATPVMTNFAYDITGDAYYGDSVVGDRLTYTSITDPYETTKDLSGNKAERWSAVPATFSEAGNTSGYALTFTAEETNNYNELVEHVTLSAKERTPDLGMKTDGSTEGFALNVTENVNRIYGDTSNSTVTVNIKNTGNVALTSLTLSKSGTNASDFIENTTGMITANLGKEGETSFTFTVPTDKTVSGTAYTVTFNLEGVADGDPSKTVTATYTYNMKVIPAELDHATLTGLVAPVAGAEPDDSVVQEDGETYNALYTVKSVTWTGDLKDGKFQPGVQYAASITLEPTNTTNYVFVDGVYKLDGVTAATSGTVSYKVNSDGTLTITHTYDVLAVSGVTGVLAPVDHSSASITSLSAMSGVETRLYYALFDTEQSGITAEEIKTAAQSGSYNSVSAIPGGHGQRDATSMNGVAQWTDAITVSGLTGGGTYYLYVAAQPVSEEATTNGLAMGSASATLGKKLTVSANGYGKVTYGSDEVAANSSADLTMTADGSFTAVPTNATQFGFVQWTGTAGNDSTTNPFSYVLNARANDETLGAIFHRKLNGSFTISGTLGAGQILSADLSDGTLFAGDDQVTDTAAADLSYQWKHSSDGSTWSNVSGSGTGSTYTIPNDGTYAGHSFQLVISYTDPDNGGNASTVSAETGAMTLPLAAPGVTLAKNTANGGLTATVTPSTDDTASDSKVDHYEVTLYDAEGNVAVAKQDMPAVNGNTPFGVEFDWAVLDMNKTYTVKVQAIPKASNGYGPSTVAEASETPAKKPLTLSDLTTSWLNKVFSGFTQTALGTAEVKGGITGAGTVTVYYSDSDGDTSGKMDVGTYNMYVSVSEGDRYTALARTAAGTWDITQAPSTLALAKVSDSMKTGQSYDVTTAAPYVTYSNADSAKYNDGDKHITGYYTLSYTLKSVPVDSTISTGVIITEDALKTFTPDKNGVYVFEVSAGYGSATADFKRDIAEPAQKPTFTLTVSDRVVTGITLEKGAAVNLATYGTSVGAVNTTGQGYYDGSTAANAKTMHLDGLKITITYDDGAPDVYVVGDSSNPLPSSLVWNNGNMTDTSLSDKVLSFNNKAASSSLSVSYAGESSLPITFTLNARELDYATGSTSGTKVYDGTVAVADGKLTTADVLSGDTADLTTTGYTLDNPNVGTGKPITANGVTVTGAQSGFYTPGTQTNGTMSVTAVIIDGIKVTTQTPTAGANIIKTIDGTTNKVTNQTGGALSGLTGTSTITWQEKDGGTWKTTTDATFQPGKEYRPVVTVTADENHKLGVTDDYTINTNKNGQNSAAITTDDTDPGNTGTFIGAPTALPGTPVLKFQDVNQSNASDKKDPATSVTRNISVSTGATLGKYTVTLSNSGEVIYDVYLTNTGNLSDKIALTPATINQMNVGDNQDYTLDLSGVSTSAAFVGQVIITARGAATDGGVATIQATYTLNLSVTSGGGGGGGGGATELTVTYDLQGKGTSKDALSETVASGGKPAKVPAVTANKGYTFKGWSQSDPSKTEEPKLVDPKTVTIKADTTFYAVYDGPVTGEHEHYIKGYDTGIFGPADDITRSQVAAIIARACLDGFHEDTDYGNGGYTDVANDHWARSAIAFVTEAGVFEGDGEGHFDPDRPITRQEFALVFARMAGLLEVGETPFSDAATTADWAMAGVYTAYAKGWLDGYNDGTFKPWNNIMRSEAVKIVNRYLNRGVNAEGIVDVYSELKQWSDVPSTYWAYYEILEASNDHTYFYADGVQPPEVYTKAYIEEASWGK